MKPSRLILRDIVKTFELPTIQGDASAQKAVEKMLESSCYSLLVPRKNKNDAYGIVTKKDILSKVVAEGKDLKKFIVVPKKLANVVIQP